jgi:hypothetical protein
MPWSFTMHEHAKLYESIFLQLNAAMPSPQQKQKPEINIAKPLKPPTNSGVQNPHCVPYLQMCNATTPSEKEEKRQCKNHS